MFTDVMGQTAVKLERALNVFELTTRAGRAYLWVLADNAPARTFYEWRGFQLLERENVVEIDGRRLREACYAKAIG